jgi:hypothetical protein
MGLIGDILYLPIRLAKIPLKILTFPLRVPGRIIFGSKKDQLERERITEKQELEKEKKQMKEKGGAPVPFYMSGNPDDMKTVCKHIDMNKADEKSKSICASVKEGGSRKRKRKNRGKTRKGRK